MHRHCARSPICPLLFETPAPPSCPAIICAGIAEQCANSRITIWPDRGIAQYSESQGEVSAVRSHLLQQFVGHIRIPLALRVQPKLAAQACNAGRLKLRLERCEYFVGRCHRALLAL